MHRNDLEQASQFTSPRSACRPAWWVVSKKALEARRTIDTLRTRCGVEVQQVEGLPDVTPFDFDRIW